MDNFKNIKVVPLFTKVKKVKETADIEEVNRLVKENWILLQIVPRANGVCYSLGEIDLDPFLSNNSCSNFD